MPVAGYLIRINDYGVHGQLSGRKRGLLLVVIPAILMDLRISENDWGLLM
jgi:hypothetical protein